jgi:hypothetical protein
VVATSFPFRTVAGTAIEPQRTTSLKTGDLRPEISIAHRDFPTDVPLWLFLTPVAESAQGVFRSASEIDLKACYGHKAGSSSHLFEEGRVRPRYPIHAMRASSVIPV